MLPYRFPLVVAAILMVIACLAILDIIPAAVASYAPLAALPFLLRSSCRVRSGKAAV